MGKRRGKTAMDHQETRRRFATLTTAHLADACIRAHIPVRCAPALLQALVPGSRLVGRASPARHVGSVDVFWEALEGAGPGDVLVVDNGGRLDESCVGDLVALEVRAAGLEGIVIWGLHRDTADIRAIGLPVFSLGAIPTGPQRLDVRPEVALESAVVGDWTVSREDLILGDDDGVLLVPVARAGDIFTLAEAIRDTERRQAELMRGGVSLRSQVHFDVYLAQREEAPSLRFRDHLPGADGVAMLAEDLELARNFGSGEEIAGIGILGDQPQGFLFPAAADEDGWVRAREGLRRVERALELIVLATERLFAAAFAFPHLLADLECLLEPLEPLLDGRERDAEAAALGFVPCGADAQPGAAAGEDVESGDRLGENARLMVDDARHHGAEFRSLGHRRNVAERAVAFEHLVVFRAVHADLPEVVHHPDGIETGLVRRARNVGERGAEVGRPRRPGEISDVQSDLHGGSSRENISELDEAAPLHSE